MHALSFLKVGYLVTFFKKSQIMIFPKKEKNIPLLLYATAELGEMALAYSRSLLKKKKACLGSHCDSAKYIYVHSLLQKHQYVSIP